MDASDLTYELRRDDGSPAGRPTVWRLTERRADGSIGRFLNTSLGWHESEAEAKACAAARFGIAPEQICRR